jgi:hypothetical protein
MSDHQEHTGSKSMTYLYIALAIVGLAILTILRKAITLQ